MGFLNLIIMLQLRKATRQKAKIRLGLSSVSGGGKTYSSILIAKGLATSMDKIALIDTENGSGDLYANLGDYNVITLDAPYTPERYIEAITACENAGMEVIVIDSITHEWDGKGGILEISNSMVGNSYTNWAKLTPRHQSFIDKILQCKAHVITTVRRKQDYEMTTNSSGKLVPQKVGLKEVTREGFEYELTVNLELDTNHNATVSKDRTGLFVGKPDFIPTEETGKLLLNWCENGIEPIKKIPTLTANQFKLLLTKDISTVELYIDNLEQGYLELTKEQVTQLNIYYETLKPQI
jgi:hypothetical protein